MLKQQIRRPTFLHMLRVASVCCLCALLMLACTSKRNREPVDADHTDNALESGEAAKAARASVTGQWRWSPTTHDRVDLSDSEIDLLNGLDKRTRAGFSFKKDGTFRLGARLGDKELQERKGTWDVTDIELQAFSVVLHFEDEEQPTTLHVTPRSDGNLDVDLEERQFVLRKAPIDGYLAEPKKSDGSETRDE